MPPFLIARRHIAMKVEAVEGTPESLADADVIAPAFGIEYAAAIEFFNREVVQASFSRITQIAGERSATWLTRETKGSGVVSCPMGPYPSGKGNAQTTANRDGGASSTPCSIGRRGVPVGDVRAGLAGGDV